MLVQSEYTGFFAAFWEEGLFSDHQIPPNSHFPSRRGLRLVFVMKNMASRALLSVTFFWLAGGAWAQTPEPPSEEQPDAAAEASPPPTAWVPPETPFSGEERPVSFAAGENSPFGVNAAPGLANDGNRQDLLAALGVGWVRVNFPWHLVELAPGACSAPEPDENCNWREPDDLVRTMRERNIWILWDFSYAPCWANGQTCLPDGRTNEQNGSHTWAPTDQHQNDLRSYVMAVVAHFRGEHIVWSGWNEPDLVQFYKFPGNANGQTNITRYKTKELLTIVNAIIAADPSATIAVGDLSSQVVKNYSQSPPNNLPKLVLDAVKGKFQIITQHVYDGNDTCDERRKIITSFAANIQNWGSGIGSYGKYPVWITETGGLNQPTLNSVMNCLYPEMRLGTRPPWWSKMFWYTYETVDNGNGNVGLLENGPDPDYYFPATPSVPR